LAPVQLKELSEILGEMEVNENNPEVVIGLD
jgi:hypothetical protein